MSVQCVVVKSGCFFDSKTTEGNIEAVLVSPGTLCCFGSMISLAGLEFSGGGTTLPCMSLVCKINVIRLLSCISPPPFHTRVPSWRVTRREKLLSHTDIQDTQPHRHTDWKSLLSTRDVEKTRVCWLEAEGQRRETMMMAV